MQEKAKEPEIRFAGFTGAWEQRKLGAIVQITMGQSPDGSTYSDTPADYILVQGNADLKNGWVCPRVWTTQKTKFATAGDLIMSVRAPAGSVGKTAYDVVLGRGVASLKGNEFIYQSLVKMDFDGYWKAESTGSTFESLSSDSISTAELYCPSEDEQHKIGIFLSRLDSLLTLHQRKYEKLLNIKKSMLEKMFPKEGEVVPEIRFKGFTGAWEQRKLGNLGETYTGLSGKSKEDFGHGTAKFITYMNVYSNPVSDPEGTDLIEVDNRQNTVRKGDVLFTTSSETPEEVGMSSVVFESIENTYLNSFCFGYRPKIEFNNFYLAFLLRSGGFRKNIIFLAQGISRYNISKNAVMNIPIPIPAKEEQEAIGDFFKHLDALLTLHQRKLEMLKNVKQAFLEKMFV